MKLSPWLGKLSGWRLFSMGVSLARTLILKRNMRLTMDGVMPTGGKHSDALMIVVGDAHRVDIENSIVNVEVDVKFSFTTSNA